MLTKNVFASGFLILLFQKQHINQIKEKHVAPIFSEITFRLNLEST